MVNTCYDSYSVLVVLFRIIHTLLPSLPVQFGTAFVFCIRIPYSVLGRPLSPGTVWHGFRILYSYSVSCTKPYRLDLATAQYSWARVRILLSYSVLCIGTDHTLSQYGLSWIRRTSVKPRIPYSVFCILYCSHLQTPEQTEYEYEEYNTIRNMY